MNSRSTPPGPPTSPERYYTVAEVAEIYRVDPRTVRNWIYEKALRSWRRGRLVRIPQTALDEFDEKA